MLELPDMISLPIILTAVLIFLLVGVKSIKSYRENKLTQSALFAIAVIAMAIAMVLLVGEKLLLTVIGDPELGMLIGGVALSISGIAVVGIDAFSFNMVFPKKYKVLTAISAVVETLYLAFWWADPTRIVEEGEIVFGDLFGLGFKFTPMLAYFTAIPLLVIPVVVFFYYALKVRNESSVASKRSWLLGIGLSMIATAYIVEIIGIDPMITAIIRSLFVFGGLLMYWGLYRIKVKE